MKLVAILIIAAVFSQLAVGLSPAETETIRAAVSERRYDEAIAGLLETETRDPDRFRDYDLDYLLGRIHEKRGDLGSALARYGEVAGRHSALRAYALFRSASVARAMGNLFAERVYLRELAATEPKSLVAETARVRLARSSFESADLVRAALLLETITPFEVLAEKPGQPDPVSRENRLLLARARFNLGDSEAARAMLAELIRDWPRSDRPDDAMIAAVRELDRIDLGLPMSDRTALRLTADEHLQRAFVYLFDRDLTTARSHFNAIVTEHPASGHGPESLFQIGRCFAQESNFPEAIRSFERLQEQYPEHPVARKALLQGASAYSRVGKHRESVRRYQEYIARFPSEPDVDRAYLNIVDVLRDAGEETEALKWTATISETFPGTVTDAQGAFAAARIHIARNNWDDAMVAFARLNNMPDLGGARVPGGTTKDEVQFLRAFVLEQKRSFEEAIEAYLSIPDGRDEYYGSRATERLLGLVGNQDARAAAERKLSSLVAQPFDGKDHEADRRRLQAALRLTADPAERVRLLELLKNTYSKLPAYNKAPTFNLLDLSSNSHLNSIRPGTPDRRAGTIAARLLSLGLFDEAAPEIEALHSGKAALPDDLAFTIAVVNARGGRAHKAVTFAESAWRAVPADYQIELIDPDQFSILYPAIFHDDFQKYSAPRAVDPRFLLSLARQESRFDPAARSDAAARGLMQFISPTARKTASSLNISSFDPAQLYEPSTAILFASEYVADLFKLFPKQPEAVAASYNGGEDNMSRWMKRSKSDLADRYVPEIAYAQTKDYVYKVMAAYRVYRMRYGLDLRPVP